MTQTELGEDSVQWHDDDEMLGSLTARIYLLNNCEVLKKDFFTIELVSYLVSLLISLLLSWVVL
jgi:hypothetical protein